MENHYFRYEFCNLHTGKWKITEIVTKFGTRRSKIIHENYSSDLTIRPRPVAYCGSYRWIYKPRNAIRCATWALNSCVCLSAARQGLGNVSLAFRLLTLTDVRIGPIETFREIERFFEGLSRASACLWNLGVRRRIVDYNTNNIYVYTSLSPPMMIYSCICYTRFWIELILEIFAF